MFTAKWSRKKSSHIFLDPIHTHAQPPQYQHPAPEGTFVTTDKPTVTHNYHPEFMLALGFSVGVARSMGFDKCLMTYIYRYGITE